ncbi:hypothetical protein PLESTB_000825600 [Pleodorina starrii]|uniref:TsaA-like domain-containing protein n=1 Tax=Pleodorina starrii TaxID=330485 RepID=A0A9W6F2D6_9CHLO|nr:hypothetical protein PLESTB_000825600 [Pleodorina starrii]GLC64579.1 hypothetical protein PLESTF_000181000 [Pleodorina starrii]
MAWDRNSVLERCAVSAATAWGFYLLARFVNHRWHLTTLQQQLQETLASLEHERVKRKADRVGRIRAEQELRSVKVQMQRLQLQAQLQPQPQGQQNREEQEEAEEEQLRNQQEPDQEGGDAAAVAAAADSAALRQEAECGEEGAPPPPSLSQQRQRQRGKGTEAEAEAGGDAAALGAKRAAAAAAAALAAAGSAMPAFPFRPIGHLKSVFSERNGTPRQPQLVPAARSRLVLCPDVPAACLEGLTQYSHCWVLYVFHANTDLAKYLSPNRSGLKAKIHVPRLNGGRMGVLATRSPHRPSPIGLSTAEVIGVEGNSLILGGADIVDGSPVLDIKPYVPFCDCLPAARAPAWVQAEAEDEPLAVREVVVGEAARAALERAWRARKAHSMYRSAEQYLELVRQVRLVHWSRFFYRITARPAILAPCPVPPSFCTLSRPQVLNRDIRSVHQRLHVRPTTTVAAAAASKPAAAASKPAAAASKPAAAASKPAAAASKPAAAASKPAAAASKPAAAASKPAAAASKPAAAAVGATAAAAAGGTAGAAETANQERQQQGAVSDAADSGGGGGGGGGRAGEYHVVLENIYISYDISPTGVVELCDAWVDPITAR